MIKVVTLAPNMEGAEEFIKELHDEVVISLGHTGADYDCAAKAMKEGALHVTHLYNAMNPMGHRAPGMIGAAADNEECMVELIGDGIHIHPVTVRNTFRLFGPERGQSNTGRRNHRRLCYQSFRVHEVCDLHGSSGRGSNPGSYQKPGEKHRYL